MRVYFLILFAAFQFGTKANCQEVIKGITMVAPPDAFKSDVMQPFCDIYANYVKLVPYAFTRKGTTKVVHNIPMQWWGEKQVGVIESIEKAQAKGLAVFLKPQVYIPGSWVGELSFETEAEWIEWESNYRDYILSYIEIANTYGVEMFCIGTEFRESILYRSEFWENLIDEIKASYNGMLTYSANWDSYLNVPFWEKLDFIGISAYFPLVDKKTPKKEELIKAWAPIVKELDRYSKKMKKKILFTEYGYLSVDNCADKTWELEKKVHSLSINEKAQSNALDALYTVFFKQDFWAGGFLWKWFPEMKGHEGYPKKDYTPQNKLAIKVIEHHFGSSN